MMGALIARDMRLIARDCRLRVVILGYLFVFLTASVLQCLGMFAAGNLSLNAGSLFASLAVLQAALLGGLAPWMILHSSGLDCGVSLMRLIAGTSAAPWHFLLGRIVSLGICFAELLSLSLPVSLLMRLFGAASFLQIAWSLADTFLFLMALTLFVLLVSMHGAHWAVSWILSYLALAVLGLGWVAMASAIDHASITLIFLLLLVLLGSLLLLRGGRKLVYINETARQDARWA